MEIREAVNVLEVNNVDLGGRRYNGYDLIEELRPLGIDVTQAVTTKESRNPAVTALMNGAADRNFQRALERVESRHSLNGLLYPWGRTLARTRAFAAADIVHYHVIHNQVVSLFDLPDLFAAKPSVWTIHDPWPLTGHCVHPLECEGWLTGCAPCPHLDRLFPLETDCAHEMWRIKREVFSRMDPDVVVASAFMLDKVRRSPLTSGFERVHVIPFGVDVRQYLPDTERSASRRALGIPESDFVLAFRASTWDVKGLSYIIAALAERAPDRRTTLLAVDRKGLLRSLTSEYNVVELGWVHSRERYVRALNACDALLMPSLAEAFGLMAVEAMAAGRPVVCFDGTALPSVTHAPECGIAVPLGDSHALREAIDLLAEAPEEARRRGELGRTLAAELYDHDRYLHALASLYRAVAERGEAIDR